ncbi:MAG: ABC transporter ATP-binding protein [Lachnospira sp.]|nr:ABC transporter ATP-binding protein [Lachnospira sp.]
MIKLENIVKIYDANVENKRALDDVNLTIEDGEFVAVIGPSGSGKSTLLNIIGCMDSATEGTYELNGQEVTKMNAKQVQKVRRDNIGFVFQHFALMDYYTAYENIELPLLARNEKSKNRKKLVIKTMEELGILAEINKVPGKMSGGQRQRVAIARALVTGCNILLADEPTGALDQNTGKEVLELLKEINKKGTTVIIVTHDMNIAKQANRVIEIVDGKIV